MKIEGHTITTVVSDFDGTIIRPGTHEPPALFFTAVEALLEQDIQFVAASGRQYPNLKRMLAPLANHIGFIAENGALVVWKGNILHKRTIQRTLAMELIADMKCQPASEILVSGEGTSYIVPNTSEYAYMLEHKVKNVVAVLENFSEVPEDILKVSIFYPGGIPAQAEESFHKKYDSFFHVVESGNGWLDFMPAGCGKGSALKILSEKMGFDLTLTAAFGDSENDISMLQEAGLGIAMSFARQQVKDAADITCNCVEEVLLRAVGRIV